MSRPLFDTVREVEEHIKGAPHLLVCLDYDGTLTQFTATPLEAHLSQQMDRVLIALAEHQNASVAIFSGRDRADLQSRVGIPGLIYAGNHGLEISGPGYLFVEPAAASHVNTLEEMVSLLTEKLRPLEGTLVEYKGLTISVHYRQVPADHLEEVRRLVHAALAGAPHPFVLTTGEKVFEIRPRVYWNKANAIDWIMEKLAKPGLLPIYVGDDPTDEDAFTALTDGISVKVGSGKETAARYELQGPAEVRRFLELVEELVRQKEFHHEEAANSDTGYSALVP